MVGLWRVVDAAALSFWIIETGLNEGSAL